MQVVNVTELAPGVCFICELRPTEAQSAIDTRRDFNAGGPCYLNGRRYVCESCVKDMARAFGLIDAEKADALVIENDVLRQEVSAMKDRAKQIAEQILGEVPIEPKVKAVAKRKKEDVQKD